MLYEVRYHYHNFKYRNVDVVFYLFNWTLSCSNTVNYLSSFVETCFDQVVKSMLLSPAMLLVFQTLKNQVR